MNLRYCLLFFKIGEYLAVSHTTYLYHLPHSYVIIFGKTVVIVLYYYNYINIVFYKVKLHPMILYRFSFFLELILFKVFCVAVFFLHA